MCSVGKPTGFEDSDIKKLELLANSVAALVRQQAAEVIFHSLDETDEAEAGLKDMLSDFGRFKVNRSHINPIPVPARPSAVRTNLAYSPVMC